jgi:hypothetical protein
MVKKNIRKIKCLGNCIPKGEKYLHPIKLTIENNNNNNICPTKHDYDGISSNAQWDIKCLTHEKLSAFELSKYMSIPYINLSPRYLLKIYNINNIDDLIKWINQNINNKQPYNYINRIVNIWIKINIELLLVNNKILYEIYLDFQKKYWKINIDDKIFLKETEKFIKKYFKKLELIEFDFNIGNNLYNFLVIKYKK